MTSSDKCTQKRFRPQGVWVASVLAAALLVPGWATAAEQKAGSVWMVKGQVRVQGQTGAERTLRLGDDVANGEAVSSSADSEAVLKMADGAMLALRPNSQFKIDNVKRPDASGGAFALSLLRGGLRIVSGLVGKRSPDAYKVRTPVATIGIRGTDHEPYVLPSGTKIGRNPAGTYDKVNQGATFIESEKGMTDLQPGQVGFARDASDTSDDQRTRALATLLRPVILRYVPEFYRQGAFDHELAAAPQALDGVLSNHCDADVLARKWLGALDGAVVERDSKKVLELFASDAKVAIKVQASQAGGTPKSYAISREEFVDSVVQSVKDLEEFSQLRRSIRVTQPAGRNDCSDLNVASEVQESGRAAGQFYQSNSVETFALRKVGQGYQAVKAEVEAMSSR